jgi:hypothetical protein
MWSENGHLTPADARKRRDDDDGRSADLCTSENARAKRT